PSLHWRENLRLEIGQGAGSGIFEALSTRRGDVIAAPPQMDLLVAKALGGLGFVKALQVAIVALVEGLVFFHGEVTLPEHVKDNLQGADRALQHRREGAVKAQPCGLEFLAGLPSFFFSPGRKRHLHPAGEAVLQVTLRLAMTQQHQMSHLSSSGMRTVSQARFVRTDRRRPARYPAFLA